MGSTNVVESWSFFERFCFALFLGFAKVVVVVALGANWRFIYRGFACGLERMEISKKWKFSYGGVIFPFISLGIWIL
jgi:hypothetical protein